MRLEQTSIAQFTSMACVRLLDGTDVMTTEEYSVWRDELRGNEDEDCFFDALRRNLAKRFPVIYWYLFSLFFLLSRNTMKINQPHILSDVALFPCPLADQPTQQHVW